MSIVIYLHVYELQDMHSKYISHQDFQKIQVSPDSIVQQTKDLQSVQRTLLRQLMFEGKHSIENHVKDNHYLYPKFSKSN